MGFDETISKNIVLATAILVCFMSYMNVFINNSCKKKAEEKKSALSAYIIFGIGIIAFIALDWMKLNKGADALSYASALSIIVIMLSFTTYSIAKDCEDGDKTVDTLQTVFIVVFALAVVFMAIDTGSNLTGNNPPWATYHTKQYININKTI